MTDLGTIGITDEHRELHATARRWVEAHVDPAATRALLDLEEPALPACWPGLEATGWLGLAVPEATGGEGFGLLELAVVLEELGRAATPGPFLPTALVATVLGRPVDGVGGVGLLAAGARPSVTGRTADGATVLDGGHQPVLGGGLADRVLVPYAPEGEPSSVRWAVVDRGAPGVDLRSLPSTDATRPVGRLELSGAAVVEVVPATDADRVGALAQILLGAEAVGSMAWCVATAAEYAAVREQFGRPIGQFQAVKHRCAEMALRLEQARGLVWDAARAADEGDATALAFTAAAVGAIVPDAALEVAKDCIQVLGGIGYTWEHDAHVHAKRALADRQLLGRGAGWAAALAELSAAGVRRSLRAALPPEAEPIRAEVRAFIAETQARPKAEWNRHVADHGYLVPNWPRPWGREASPVEQLVIDEEFEAARLRRPHLQVAAWVLPTIINHGTMAQQERWVRPTLRGELLWCQLFSEPGAGSDLASLQMRAERVAGGWSLTGQKVWTTMAHLAQWGLCLARTSPDKPKHEGITAFVVDMASPGIECRPLRELTGAALFNEVFFDAVFVPDDAVIGAVDEGWEAARTTLGNERVSMGSGSSFGPRLESLVDLWSRRGREDSGVGGSEIGRQVAEGHAVAALGLRATLLALAGVAPGATASVRKLLGVEHEQAVQEVALDVLGPDAAAVDGEAALWVNGFLGNRALSIAGGTSDIQRNIVAERLLGLPKDP